MGRTFIQRVLLFAFFYYAFFLALDALIFLLSHVPPSAANLDSLILSLGEVEAFLTWPRLFMRYLWPGESTPTALKYLLPFLNCLIWGLLLAGLKELWNRARK
jgi:hypothetical protein